MNDVAEHRRLAIVHQDNAIVAINKPAGLLVHRSAIDYHEPHNALDILQSQLSLKVYPVHRLDKPTSGLLLFALDKHIAASIAVQFQNHEIEKEYLAIVRGHTNDYGSVDNPVRDKDAAHKPRKEALTTYTTLARITLPIAVDRYTTSRYSLIKVQPESGRRHQIRQHMKHISHPLIGDTSYGKTVHNKFFKQHFDCSRLLLHAYKLTLTHPKTNEKIALSAGYDNQFKQLIEQPEWQWTADPDQSSFSQECMEV